MTTTMTPSRPIAPAAILSMIDSAARIDVLVERGGIDEIIEATWFASAPDVEDEDPVHIDSDSDSGAMVCMSELRGARVTTENRVILRDGRTLSFFKSL